MVLRKSGKRNRTDEITETMTLADLRPGQTARVVAIATEESGRMLKLAALGLVPGCTIRLQQRRPAYVIWVGETLLSLAREVAADIRVQVQV